MNDGGCQGAQSLAAQVSCPQGRGVQPDRRVVETDAGLAEGRDPVLEAAPVALKVCARGKCK